MHDKVDEEIDRLLKEYNITPVVVWMGGTTCSNSETQWTYQTMRSSVGLRFVLENHWRTVKRDPTHCGVPQRHSPEWVGRAWARPLEFGTSVSPLLSWSITNSIMRSLNIWHGCRFITSDGRQKRVSIRVHVLNTVPLWKEVLTARAGSHIWNSEI